MIIDNIKRKILQLPPKPPKIFMIETSLMCNLKCPECAIGGDLIKRKQKFMSFEQFKIIADKIRPFANGIEIIYLHIWGEPMLNKDIIKIIKYASVFAKTNISTNGLTLTQEKAEELITSGVRSIIISIDGATQEVYEKYRVGGNLKKALQTLKILHGLNIRYNNKVSIIPQFIVFKHNQHEMEKFKEICNSIGVTPAFKSPYVRSNSALLESDMPEYRRKRYKNKSALKKAMRHCQDPQKVFTVLIDGTVVACCYDHDGKTNFGNIFTQDVLEIWNNSQYLKFRRNIITGNTPEFCIENCLEYFLE